MKPFFHLNFWLGTFALLFAILLIARLITSSGTGPPPTVQGQSFSIREGDPFTLTGVHPADILSAGGYVLIPCFNLGLLCGDDTGAKDELNALSFGVDFIASDLPPLQFSVALGSQGLAGTAVRSEANCTPSENQTDAFETPLDGTNLQDLDGDGVPCGSNQGFALGLTEGATPDHVDALERDPCQYVDVECDGELDQGIFLTLSPGSPTLSLLGADAADILLAGVEFLPVIWADGLTDLGLLSGDVLDALCVYENGNGVYDAGDQVMFSLAPGSPTLNALSASPADLFSPAPVSIVYSASQLGLETTDDVDALVCAGDILTTPTVTPSPTPTGTLPTSTPTPTQTHTYTPSPTGTLPTPTHTPTPTPTSTETLPVLTDTPTPTSTLTLTPLPPDFEVHLPLIIKNE